MECRGRPWGRSRAGIGEGDESINLRLLPLHTLRGMAAYLRLRCGIEMVNGEILGARSSGYPEIWDLRFVVALLCADRGMHPSIALMSV